MDPTDLLEVNPVSAHQHETTKKRQTGFRPTGPLPMPPKGRPGDQDYAEHSQRSDTCPAMLSMTEVEAYRARGNNKPQHEPVKVASDGDSRQRQERDEQRDAQTMHDTDSG